MAVDSRIALAKLTSGQTLTPEEKQILGLSTGSNTSGTTSGASTSGVVPGFTGPKITPLKGVTGDVQGPMIGNNLGRDAAYAMGQGAALNATQKAAGEAYNVAQGLNPDGSKKQVISDETRDAFTTMGLTLKEWGLEGLADTYTRLMTQGLSAGEALTKLKYDKTVDPVTGKPWNAAYSTRFAGNVARVAAGMNAYDEATYLDVENAYEETLRRYGLNNMVKADKAAATAQYADYMAKGIAPKEFAERIKTVSDGVIGMDKATKDQWKTWYPSLTDNDIISYFLNPQETLPVLEQKVAAAQIGAVAGAAGYGITEARGREFAAFGVDRAKALEGYQNVAEAVPAGTKLSGIYGEEGITYGQTAAEDEFLKSDAQAKLKRNRLASKERAMFQGQSGVDAGSLVRGSFGTI